MRVLRPLKKPILLAISAITLTFLGMANLYADAGSDQTAILNAIKINTDNILSDVNGLPNYITNMLTYLGDLTAADESPVTSDMVPGFAALVSSTADNLSKQNSKQPELMANMFGYKLTDLTAGSNGVTPILNTVPQVNSVTYGTLLGVPTAAKGTGTPIDYVKNAAGLGIYHDAPSGSWGGGGVNVGKYQGYFNTISAVESYDMYLLSGLWAEADNQYKLTATQTDLLTKITNTDKGGWLQSIASESVGVVLRQILLIESQSYVVLTQMFQVQKQQLAATAMTNTLLIANGQSVESILEGKAQGTMK